LGNTVFPFLQIKAKFPFVLGIEGLVITAS
jgi:hypothetical protein